MPDDENQEMDGLLESATESDEIEQPDETPEVEAEPEPAPEPETIEGEWQEDGTFLAEDGARYDKDGNLLAADTQPVSVPEAEGGSQPAGEAKKTYAPTLPPDLYTAQEVESLQAMLESADSMDIIKAHTFMAQRVAQRENLAQSIAQSYLSEYPADFVKKHGPAISEYLSAQPAAERGKKETAQQAITYAVHQDAVSSGDFAGAFERAAKALRGQPTAPAVKAALPPSQKLTRPTAAGGTTRPLLRSRQAREEQALKNALPWITEDLAEPLKKGLGY